MADRKPHDPEQCARAWQSLRIAHNLVEEQLVTALETSCGLSLHEFDALLVLHLTAESESRMQDLLGPVPLSQPALSRLIARLVDRGLVERGPGSDDGRVTLVKLTDAGRNTIASAIEIHARTVHNAVTSRLSQSEQDRLLETLSRIANPSD